jgi:hypothetical protein
MKIRILLVAVLCGLFSVSLFAQTSDEEIDALANLWSVQKKQAMAQLVPVAGKDSVSFWTIYNEYLEKNKATMKSRLKLYESTAKAYNFMTPGTADSLARKYFSIRSDQEKSLEVYYNKVKAATNAVTALPISCSRYPRTGSCILATNSAGRAGGRGVAGAKVRQWHGEADSAVPPAGNEKIRTFAAQFQLNQYGNSNQGEYRPFDRQNYRQHFERRLSAVFRTDAETIWQTGKYSGFPERDGTGRTDQKDVRQFGIYR